jgi:O-methyltransferase
MILGQLYQRSRTLRTAYLRSVGRLRTAVMLCPPYSASLQREILRTNDPVRQSAFAAALVRLRTENIHGEMAELGVFRGETSRLIRKIEPDRPYHLFDTFEGFSHRDGELVRGFEDTAVDVVTRNIGNMAGVFIHKGYFPETALGLEDHRFAFVILDADLYKPLKAGLEFFYPRMTRGGYIFVHDYNWNGYDWGGKRAVDEFLSDKVEALIEIPDRWGSIVFRKQ